MSTTDQEREALLPCPFCGHVGLDFEEGSTFRWIDAFCANCGASAGETCVNGKNLEERVAVARMDAIRQWNTRATPPAPQSTEAELRARIAELEAVNSQLRDSECDKVLAMTDQQIDVLTRLEGRDPQDVVKIGKMACELAIRDARIARLEAVCKEAEGALILMVRTHDEPAETLLQETKEQQWIANARDAIASLRHEIGGGNADQA